MNTIKCPFCGNDIEITNALSRQVEQSIIERERLKHEKELTEIKQLAAEESAKKTKEQFAFKLQQAQEENEAQEQRNKQLVSQVSELIQQMRDIKREKEDMKADMLKRLSKEEERIWEEAQQKAAQEQASKIRELEQQRVNAIKEADDLKRKLLQGSQQLQGEAFEIEFENLLKKEFPNDVIQAVGKGVKGGDLIQEVWDKKGNYNGKILWELKNTKNWQEIWVEKLKSDKRSINAEESVIITDILPPGLKVAGYYNGIWATQHSFAITLASTLRAKLIEVYYAKQSVQSKDGKMELMYSYLSGTEFKYRIEAIVEAFTNMQNEIEKEKRYFMNKWSRDEKNIRLVIDNTYGMHGDLKAIIGRTLPQIKGLDAIDFDTKDSQLSLSDDNDK